MSANPLLPKPREMWVELVSGDFEPRKQELERLMVDAADKEKGAKRFGARSEVVKLAKEYDELMEQARAEGIVKILVRAAGRPWRRLKDDHPPRRDNESDEVLGVNRLTFFEPAVQLCIVEPKVDQEQYDEFVEGLSSAQWDRVCSAAWQVNEGEPSIPKLSAVSLLQQMRDDASKSAASTASIPEPSTENPPSSATTDQTES